MIILWLAVGIAAGIIAGLIPGIHSNNLAVLLAASPVLGDEAMAFMLGMCTAQIFTEFIPSVFIGAPAENTFESILPAHKMLLEGKGFEAICLTSAGALIAIIIGALITPAFFILIEKNSQAITHSIPLVLAFALAIFVLNAKGTTTKIATIFVITAAGMQGLLFTGQVFPLITGYFGVSEIAYSLREKNTLAPQQNTARIEKQSIIEALIGTTGGAIVSVMPGIGSNTAAGIINSFRKSNSGNNYLSMLGSINASNFFFSFATMLAIEKARNGGMLALAEKIVITKDTLLFGTLMMLIAAGTGAIASIVIAKKASLFMNAKFSRNAAIISLAVMISLVAFFNGALGLTALLCASALGIFARTVKVKRSTCMSALIVPVMLFYIFISI